MPRLGAAGCRRPSRERLERRTPSQADGSTLRSPLTTLVVALAGSGASAELLAFEGRILAVLPGLGEAEVASGTGVAEIDGLQLGRIEIVSADIAGSTGLPVTDPTAAPVTSVRIAASLRSGSLAIDPVAPPLGEPAITDGTLVLPGGIRICMLVPPLPPCIAGFAIDLTKGSGGVGIGIGGLLTGGGSGAPRISLDGAPFALNTSRGPAAQQAEPLHVRNESLRLGHEAGGRGWGRLLDGVDASDRTRTPSHTLRPRSVSKLPGSPARRNPRGRNRSLDLRRHA